MKRKRISNSDRWFLMWLYDFKCNNCQSEESLEVDHIKPLAMGGEDHIENMQILCARCKTRKRDTHDGVFVYDELKTDIKASEAILDFICGNKELATEKLNSVLRNKSK